MSERSFGSSECCEKCDRNRRENARLRAWMRRWSKPAGQLGPIGYMPEVDRKARIYEDIAAELPEALSGAKPPKAPR